MGLSFWQIGLVVLLIVLLFGRGRIPALMSDLAQGIKSFKSGMSEDEHAQITAPPRQTPASSVESRDGSRV